MAPALDVRMAAVPSGLPGGEEAPAPPFGKAGPPAGAMGAEEDGDKPKGAPPPPPQPPPAPLPFSVEALMADRRKPSSGGRERDASAGGTDLGGRSGQPRTPAAASAPDRPASPLALAAGPFAVGGLVKLPEEVLVKAESPEKADRTPWMPPSPRFSPPPPSKWAAGGPALGGGGTGRALAGWPPPQPLRSQPQGEAAPLGRRHPHPPPAWPAEPTPKTLVPLGGTPRRQASPKPAASSIAPVAAGLPSQAARASLPSWLPRASGAAAPARGSGS